MYYDLLASNVVVLYHIVLYNSASYRMCYCIVLYCIGKLIYQSHGVSVLMYDLPTCFQKRKKDGKFMTVRWREPHRISQIPYLLPDRIAIRESTTCQVFATLLCSRRSREQDWVWSLSKLATFKLSHGVIVGLPGIYPPSSQCMSQKQIMFLCQFTFYYSFCFQVFFFSDSSQ